MKIPFGVTEYVETADSSGASPKRSKGIYEWDSNFAVNGHMVLTGYSGTGKTTTIRHIIRCLINSYQPSRKTPQKLRIHIFDIHDDISVPEFYVSELMFSSASEYGINPLILNTDKHSGGVNKAIQQFINIINKTSSQIGQRQEAVLRALMEDLYAAKGFYANNPRSWTLADYGNRTGKTYPLLSELLTFANAKYKQMTIGGDSKSTRALEDANREAQALSKGIESRPTTTPEEVESAAAKLQQQSFNALKGDFDADKFEKAKKLAIETYTNFVSSIQTGKELESYLKYDNRATLKSVVDRLSNLTKTGIFGDGGLPFDPGSSIWRYRIKFLGEDDEKKMFLFFRLQELYRDALLRGEQDTICEVVIVDESKKFMDGDPDNIIVKMVNELRKFGTMVICASQDFAHFTDDFLTSAATKIILGVADLSIEKTSRKLLIKKEVLQKIEPKRFALMQIKHAYPHDHPLYKFQGRWQFVLLQTVPR